MSVNGIMKRVALVLMSVIALSGADSKAAGKPYKIGAVMPLTGPAASFGQINRRGIDLALVAKNKKQVMFESAIEDGMSNPKDSLTAFRKLTQEGVKVAIASISGVALALVPVADKEKVVLFADVAHPLVTGSSSFVFRHSQTADQEAKVISGYVGKGKVDGLVGLINVNDDYGVAFGTQFQAYMRAVSPKKNIKAEAFDKTETEFRNITQKLVSNNPEAIVVCASGKALGLIIKRLRENGFNGKIYATMGFTVSPDALTVAGEAAKGVMYIDFDFDKANKEYLALEKAYKETYKAEMPVFVAVEYNTAMLLMYAVEKAGYDPEAIAKYLKKLGTYKSAGEKMTINEKGDVLPSIKMAEFK